MTSFAAHVPVDCSVWRTWRAPWGSHADADLRGVGNREVPPPLRSNQSYHVRELTEGRWLSQGAPTDQRLRACIRSGPMRCHPALAKRVSTPRRNEMPDMYADGSNGSRRPRSGLLLAGNCFP
eukprot:SAG31_NODE_4116_length_3567_cov_2.159746_3_plen_123_part_00